ncbi:MAG: diguanylate phosphodiesterase [Desulfuromonas sp.]|nr:MAG: diguanylate phosphodiesterase [Desulfuromonas sp.]
MAADQDETSGTTQRAEEFLQVFKRGAEFTQDLLRENERLRFQLLEMEQGNVAGDGVGNVEHLKSRIDMLESEKQEILSRIQEVQQENQDYDNRYSEIEAENNLLANLYISSYQLHSSLDITEIIRIIQEILLNLVGVEQFSILMLDATQQYLRPLVVEGLDPSMIASVRVGEGAIGQVLKSGERRLHTPEPSADLLAEPPVIIPLAVGDDIIGVINIYKLLQQKETFSDIDEELFNLLGAHAAMAIFTAMLHLERGGQPVFSDSFFARVTEDLY